MVGLDNVINNIHINKNMCILIILLATKYKIVDTLIAISVEIRSQQKILDKETQQDRIAVDYSLSCNVVARTCNSVLT